MPSSQVHERYKRRPMDLPWRGRKARMVVTVRRFRCTNDSCHRRTFAEDFGEDLPRYARRTREATELLIDFALKAGGEEGARLADAAGLPVSPDTLLRLIRAIPLPLLPTPRVLGVDDLALRRRYSYATLLVDLETRRPVDMVEERDAETLATWLREHPGVEVISRDRSGAYADGASAGAPDAVQVADRFHLARNASEALDGMLRGRSLAVEETQSPDEGPEDPGEAPVEAEPQTVPLELPPEEPLSPTKRIQAERRAARAARWQRVQELHRAGLSIRRIGEDVGITRRTVRTLISAPSPPRNRVLRPRPGGLTSPTLQPYVSYLQDRWQQGCTNASRLCREISAMGYAGSRSLLAQAVQPWRGPRPPKGERGQAKRLRRRSSVRWICLKPLDKLKEDEQALLERLLAQDDQLALGYELLQRFRQLLRERDLPALENWLIDAEKSDLPTFMGLAGGIRSDWAAVEAALRLPWSNGQLEGQITRVKLIKRQGYGRAKFDLLRRRVLLGKRGSSGVRLRVEPQEDASTVSPGRFRPSVELVAA
jgi:transposase